MRGKQALGVMAPQSSADGKAHMAAFREQQVFANGCGVCGGKNGRSS